MNNKHDKFISYYLPTFYLIIKYYKRIQYNINNPSGSNIAKKNFDLLRLKMRASLKRFCLCPR
jgi:hypothetical protein